jgi:predicted CXXCH cytochrome family protein
MVTKGKRWCRMQCRMIAFGLILMACVTNLAQASCIGCHGALTRGGAVHDPVAAGNCFGCHRQLPGEEHPKNRKAIVLQAQNEKLCQMCHESKGAKPFVHKPVGEGRCGACHDPHRSDVKGQLKAMGKALCLQCHTDIFSWPVAHKPVGEGDCVSCHDPHQSEYRHLLRQPLTELCYQCHDAALARGRTIHQPVDGGDCRACHAVHGANHRMLLKKAYPMEFYLPFVLERYELCFSCHERSLATEEITATTTRFRNGDTNLHYVHLMVTSGRGRSCKTCHEVHASHQEHLIRDSLPGFGSWQIPVNYSETGTGGTCVAGCHKPKYYDRMQARPND